MARTPLVRSRIFFFDGPSRTCFESEPGKELGSSSYELFAVGDLVCRDDFSASSLGT